MTATVEIIAPGLFRLVPDDWLSGIAGLDRLERLLSRADRHPDPGQDEERALCSRFGLQVPEAEDAPAGALGLLGDGGNPADHFWFCAHPVDLIADRDRVLLSPAKASALAPEEPSARAALFNRHFEVEGWYLEAPHPTRWYLRAPRALQVSTQPLRRVAARSLDAYMPSGPDASLLRRLVTETEMLFHTLDTPGAAGRFGPVTANGLWLAGGGRLPGALTSPGGQLRSDDPVAKGLAMVAGMPLGALADVTAPGAGLVVYGQSLHQAVSTDDRDAYRAAFARCLEGLLAAEAELARGGLDTLWIADGRGGRWKLSRAARRRWWRRRRPFASFCG